MNDNTMIEVTNLTKRYAGRAAVADISFTVARGEIVGLLGPNGAGKSTTMRVLACFLPATTSFTNRTRCAAASVTCRKTIRCIPKCACGNT
jgi:ABC-2 type transport system ATP-binding protein